MRELLSAAWFVLRVAWRSGPLALGFTFGEVISTALRFLQVEHQLLLLIDLQISAALPIAK